MRISIIVAASENNVIGINNMLPWRLPLDLKYFKSTTLGKPIVMGRKTFDSLGKPLPGRPNIVITRQTDFQPEGAYVVRSVEEGVEKAKSFGGDELFITGGSQIFEQAWPLVERIYLTRVYAVVHGDAFFPQLDGAEFELVSDERHEADEKNQYPFSFQVWERI
ncbi:dihydrofolate reductase [Chitinophaga ginsengisegetis]|uniref:Dihydrofolate reductase n=1 Tax=Chitinophaga ginsengisegetis TaxID=393003 RepID=A0A1T5NGY6_9BACT|nr:dihydrofolate reductase [Chitinophaga ginsengisegetis]MDR6569530.1 dihydrofolate reductase [Chitinophaga ginsengisegetis]MDR6649263.1 dihydrofolate reductase [Chitinophaga ginsengisegetis]MDR6655613.1 dihydrofolate reductase [Chitinophaga ginsengisegetis]SKC99657.1 dihydrofolate reductase [Chitinophaga ginsengisegetis]